MWTRTDAMLFLHEAHMGESAAQEAIQYYSNKGWKVGGQAAHPTGGTSGGFLTLHSTKHLTHQAAEFLHEGNGWTAIGLHRQGALIFLIQIYLKTGETLQSSSNSLILSKLMAFLHHLGAPFIIGGDWQNEPEALAATVIQSKFKATIVDTAGCATLQGSQIDYLLVSTVLVGAIAWKPAGTCPGGHIVHFRSILTVISRLNLFNSCNGFLPLAGPFSFRTSGPVSKKTTGLSTSWTPSSLAWELTSLDGPPRLRSMSPRCFTSLYWVVVPMPR